MAQPVSPDVIILGGRRRGRLEVITEGSGVWPGRPQSLEALSSSLHKNGHPWLPIIPR